MSVILDALNKAQEERKKVSSRIRGRWVTHVPRPGRRVYYGATGIALCLVLALLLIPLLYRSKPAKPAGAVPGPAASVPSPPSLARVKESTPVAAAKAEPKRVAPDRSTEQKQEVAARDEKTVYPPAPARAKKKTAVGMAVKNPSPAALGGAAASPAPEARAPGQGEAAQARIVVKKIDDERITMRYNDAVREAERGNTEEAKQLYRSILAEDPNRVEVLNNLGVLAMREGNSREALAFFRKCRQQRQDYEKAYNNMGLVLLRDGDRRQAEEHFRKAIAIDRGGIEPYLNLVSLLRSEKRFDEAAKALEAPLARNAREPALYLSFAVIKDEMGDYREAAKYYRLYLSSGGKRDDKVIERVKFLEERQSAGSR